MPGQTWKVPLSGLLVTPVLPLEIAILKLASNITVHSIFCIPWPDILPVTDELKTWVCISCLGDPPKCYFRLFFEACGFGDDILNSTTMIYSRKASTYHQGNQIVLHAGRKLLLAPPHREPLNL